MSWSKNKNYLINEELGEEIGYTKLVCVHTNGNVFDINIFRRVGDFIRRIYYAVIFMEQSIDKEIKMEVLPRNLDPFMPQEYNKLLIMHANIL